MGVWYVVLILHTGPHAMGMDLIRVRDEETCKKIGSDWVSKMRDPKTLLTVPEFKCFNTVSPQ